MRVDLLEEQAVFDIGSSMTFVDALENRNADQKHERKGQSPPQAAYSKCSFDYWHELGVR
jgi:hypothetical protein